jgi:hypothetical protein
MLCEKVKGKAESLNEKLNKTNINDMKDHTYLVASFFEQLRDIYINAHEAENIYNIDKPESLKKINTSLLKQFTYLSKNIPSECEEDLTTYGDQLCERYLRKVKILFNVRVSQRVR